MPEKKFIMWLFAIWMVIFCSAMLLVGVMLMNFMEKGC